MKTINKIFMTLGVAAGTLGLSSCVNDLDLSPVDPSVITDVSKNMDDVFADIYLNFSTFGPNGDSPVKDFDGGMAAFQRAMFTAEEMPTDEACWLWDPEKFGQINYGFVTPDVPCVFGFYSRLIINITLCNDFIQSVNDGKFDLDEAGQKRAQEYVRQARILRGACYFYMLSFYENPPYADETTPVGAQPSQPGRAEVYRLVTADLEDVVASYNNDNSTYYGFVGLDAAQSILAKIYLNAEVFTGTPDYAKCYQHSKAVIDRLGKGGKYGTGLAPTYASLFGCNNQMYVIGNGGSPVNEIIWTIPASKYVDNGNVVENLTSWSGSTFMIAAWNGSNGVETTVACPTMDVAYRDKKGEDLIFTDADGTRHIYEYVSDKEEYDAALKAYNDIKSDNKTAWKTVVEELVADVAYSFDPAAKGYITGQWFNATEGWKCMVARKSFVRKFDWNDVEMSQSNDQRVGFWQTSSHGFTAENTSLVGDDWGSNGYLAMKYTNLAYAQNGEIDYAASALVPMTACYGGDYAALRLAEVYLMAAEAILQGGGGSQAEALQYVNNIRQRAYGDNYTPWTSLSMSELQDERCRELYQENTRRTDLIRWNKWCTGYTWEWKGGLSSGTNLPEYTKSYPIPTRVMTSSSLQQMTGY
ncbi:MAG: RagB/SusD family nutrient uptake outer membrane protein [Muribaculaceae bacterium]|nr:RagB/SusD family nutrient uptake outer membrane protein [Muribaculaceae bacterium]